MQEAEPKKRTKILTKEFLAKNAYIFVIAIVLIVGISYGYTFFVQNKKIATGSITTAALTINFTDRSISASNLSVPSDDSEGMTEYSKSLTITNQTDVDGIFKLTLTRTSGLDLTDMRYALVVNGAIQEIDDVPANGEIYETAIMGGSPTGETINVELKLWPKSIYSGSETTFVGELTPEIKYLGKVASNVDSPTGKYVEFDCNGSTCEEWQIVKVEDDRLVLTKSTNYPVSGTVTNSNRFNPVNAFNDDSLITSLSTDGDSVYLAKTVKIVSGSGTQADPYVLGNTIYREEDKKVQSVITYKDNNNTTLGTQNVYYNETNYISQTYNDPAFQYWTDGTNHYILGDTITFTSDTNLAAVTKLPSTLTLTNNSVTLTYGTNGENAYTFDGDGTLSCASSDDTKVTCSVDSTNNKIILAPVAATTSSITITVSGVDGTNYFAPTSQTFTVSSISKANGYVILSASSGSYTYGGNTSFTISDSHGGALSVDKCTLNGTTVTCSGFNAGSQTVTVTSAATTNYNSATATYSLTINRKNTTMNISPTSGSVSYGSSTSTTITTDGDGTKSCTTSNASIATCSVSGNTVTINGVAVGSATITVKQAQGTNYNTATDKTYSVTVTIPPFRGTATQLASSASTYGLETNAAGNKIYSGSNPDNYVWFNSEQWRIIGVYGNNLKIIKNTPSTTSQVRNSNVNSNVWSGSTIQSTYLYNTYWGTLSATAQNMVEQSSTWNVGAIYGMNETASDSYNNSITTTWTGKIGLIAIYEYLYAAENDGTCWSSHGYNYDSSCAAKDWLFNVVTNNGNYIGWTVSPFSYDSQYSYSVSKTGNIGSYYNTNSYAASPVVFLKSTITITGGNGKSGETNSYKLG